MTPPRFIAFISHIGEIKDYLRYRPDAAFVFASYLDLGSDVVQIDPDRQPEMIELFRHRHARDPFTGVLNRKEKCVIPAARLANELGIQPILADPLLARDKLLMRRALTAAGGFPRALLMSSPSDVEQIPDDLFPCVLKPRFGFNSRSVCLAHGRAELRRIMAHQQARYSQLAKQDGTNSDFVVEELITGTEHTIETLVKDGRALLHLLSDKQPMTPPFFIEVGDLMPSNQPAAIQEQCRQAAAEAIQRIGMRNGWTHTELKLHNTRPVVIECAARMGGGYFEQLIEQVYGIDRMQTLIDIHLDRPLPEQPQPRCHIAARRLVVSGIQQVLGLENPHDIFDHETVSLIWPRTVEEIPRLVVGPPDDFNNTVCEFFARGNSAIQAGQRADDAQRRARLRTINIPKMTLGHDAA